MTDEIHDTQDQQQKPKKSPPIKIPVDFETAVEALVQVDPKKPKSGDRAKKKPDQK